MKHHIIIQHARHGSHQQEIISLAFSLANAGLHRDDITLHCTSNYAHEIFNEAFAARYRGLSRQKMAGKMREKDRAR